jgi:hypothetical protein
MKRFIQTGNVHPEAQLVNSQDQIKNSDSSIAIAGIVVKRLPPRNQKHWLQPADDCSISLSQQWMLQSSSRRPK